MMPWRRLWLFVTVFLLESPCFAARTNLLQDPGFERYDYDAVAGYYKPRANAAWREIGAGRASVRFDADGWTVPRAMSDQMPLNFTPGTEGFEGYGETQNTGTIVLEQDITPLPGFFAYPMYEAWVWFAGSGTDDDPTGEDRKKEEAGWDIWFYVDPNPASWTEANAIEHHHEGINFYGQPYRFVRVSGIGRIPTVANGARIRIAARTFGNAGLPQQFTTRVAIDNAFFGQANFNLLTNGDFEQDRSVAEFRYWQHPDPWWPSPGGVTPIDIDGFGENFDHGGFRPYYGWRYAYGYATLLMGWLSDAFSFGQEVNVDIPRGSQLALSFYWVTATKENQADLDLRRPLFWVDLGIDYKSETSLLRSETYRVDWPVPIDARNQCRYDYNTRRAFNPTVDLFPPDGTTRIGVHVRAMINCQPPAREIVGMSVDDFSLRVMQVPEPDPSLLELR